MDTARKSLKRLHRLMSQKRSSKPSPLRSLHPRQEAPDDFVESSLPPQKNLYLRAKSPAACLSSGEVSNQLLKRAYQLRNLNQRVMGRLGLPYSAHLRLSTITPQGVAVVHADSPSWVQRARFLQKNILDLLHQEGARQATQVKLKVRFSHLRPPVKPQRAIPPSSAVAHQIAEQAKQSDGELGRSLQRLSTTLLRRRSTL
ncbi:MAG: DUF721 domain-containing protein [Gammaproteobacteria bacterium]|jgi:hypothetical protein|nr:DUF721 domain-containing protein [Gammaproteobacteria bacterium]